MTISADYPPNHKQIAAVFDLSGRTPVFTYGDTIYNPYKCKLPKDLLIHEGVHQLQQTDPSMLYTPEIWWNRYLNDPQFRLQQEVEAYRKQFRYYKSSNKAWMPFLKRIASDLSSKMYGNVITFSQALVEIMK